MPAPVPLPELLHGMLAANAGELSQSLPSTGMQPSTATGRRSARGRGQGGAGRKLSARGRAAAAAAAEEEEEEDTSLAAEHAELLMALSRISPASPCSSSEDKAHGDVDVDAEESALGDEELEFSMDTEEPSQAAPPCPPARAPQMLACMGFNVAGVPPAIATR
jgi:hypothetical protein